MKEKHINDVTSASTKIYTAKKFTAAKHDSAVILDEDGIGSTNVLYVSDGKHIINARLSGWALDCLYEVLKRRHEEGDL